MGGADPNPAVAALTGAVGTVVEAGLGWPCDIAKIQGPDGFVVRLRDGSHWCVSAYRCGESGHRDEEHRAH